MNRKVIVKYLYDQLTGNFIGFLVGLSATSLVSHFFETRSIRNLWGITSKKTVVDKDTFANLEWIISIVIGFIVFEIMTKVVKAKIDESFPTVKRYALRWAVKYEIPKKMADANAVIRRKQVTILSSVNHFIRRRAED